MKSILTLILFLIVGTCFAQSNTIYVHPNETDVNYAAAQDSHMVVKHTGVGFDKLFLFIGGSSTAPDSYFRVTEFAGDLGYDVLNVSYPNSVTAVSLSNSSDAFVFDHFRQEICFGTELSDAVTVDTFNSIYTRTLKLLNHLNATYPSQNWGQYLTSSNALDWSKIAVGGHSQGAGHAAYFAKFAIPDRVLMFSGPNDYSNFFSEPANWLETSGLTPVDRHFAYLSSLDETVDFSKQLANLEDLGLYPLYDTTHVDVAVSPYGDSRCLYTTQNPGLAILYHNTTVKFSAINNSVWEYMLTAAIVSSINETKDEKTVLIYPNPTNSKLTVLLDENLLNKKYTICTMNGNVVLSGVLRNINLNEIDLSKLSNGVYFLNIEKRTFKVIKQE